MDSLKELLNEHKIPTFLWKRIEEYYFPLMQGLRTNRDELLRRHEINYQNTLVEFQRLGKKPPISATIKFSKREGATMRITHPELLEDIFRAIQKHAELPWVGSSKVSSIPSPAKTNLLEFIGRLDRYIRSGHTFANQEKALSFYSEFIDMAKPGYLSDSLKFLKNNIQKFRTKRPGKKP